MSTSFHNCREQEFSYKEGAFVSTTKPCKLREGHKPKFDVLLTSYEYIHNDFATLSSIEWGVLIIDEAHRLKNNQSLVIPASPAAFGFLLLCYVYVICMIAITGC